MPPFENWRQENQNFLNLMFDKNSDCCLFFLLFFFPLSLQPARDSYEEKVVFDSIVTDESSENKRVKANGFRINRELGGVKQK